MSTMKKRVPLTQSNGKDLLNKINYRPSTSDGLKLKKLRELEFISQKKIYNSKKYSQSYISSIENGKVAPTLEMILDYSEALGLDFYDVLLELLNAYKTELESDIKQINKNMQSVDKELSL